MVLCVESLIAKQGSESITRYENLKNTDRRPNSNTAAHTLTVQ
jgi:hypothetical protein